VPTGLVAGFFAIAAGFAIVPGLARPLTGC
jgi:hypothetical protein